MRPYKVNLFVSPKEVLEGLDVSLVARSYYYGKAWYDFNREQFGFQFEGCVYFPEHIEGTNIAAVTLEELEALVSS